MNHGKRDGSRDQRGHGCRGPVGARPDRQYLWVLTTDVAPDIVYALNTNTGVYPPHHTAAFRSDDTGEPGGPRSSPIRGSRFAMPNPTS